MITVERGCELMLDRLVVPASEDIAAVFHSPSITVEVPSVVARVAGFRHVGHGLPACSHRRVRLRDDHVCQFIVDGRPCDRRGDSVDHLMPRSMGGPSTWENLVAACRVHNGHKRDRDLDTMRTRYGWELRRSPFVPSRAFLVTADVGRRVPAWEPFLHA